MKNNIFAIFFTIFLLSFLVFSEAGALETLGQIRIDGELQPTKTTEESVTIKDVTIKTGMAKGEVSEKSKEIGIEVDKQSEERWLLGPFILIFEGNILKELPGMDFGRLLGK